MASCIKFTPNGETEPISLNALDERICELVGEEVSKTKYCRSWFDVIAYWLSIGKSYEQLRAQWTEWDDKDAANNKKEIYHKSFDVIAYYLEENYTYSTWGC
jgi:hypothetical protein